jgi:serpin B
MRAIGLPLVLPLVSLALACAPAPAPAPPPAPAPSSALASASAPASPASALPSAPAPAPAPSAPPSSLSDADRADDAKASNDFTARLYTRVRRPGNLMVSGTSVRQALAIVALGAGAASDTEREMSTALALPADRARRGALATAETAAWKEARGDAELALANRIWTERSFATKPDFTATANAAFGAAVGSVDFLHAPDVARRTINTWASEATSHRIENLLPEGSVSTGTRLVVSNAVYFKARWSSPFPKAATKNEPFTSQPGGKSDVPMMHEGSLHRFAQVGGVRVLEMRYSGSALAMLVVLPDDPAPAALAKLEESVSSDTFDGWIKALKSYRTTVTLPRFKFEYGGPLDTALQDLGMRAAYGSSADFSGIADPANGERLQITRVVQRAFVSVDENGTEAAAATGVVMTALSASQAPVAEFKADHPFLFFVYDASHGRILFAGRVTSPRS